MQKLPRIPSSEITPKAAYLSRREFILAAGAGLGGALLAGCVGAPETPEGEPPAAQPAETAIAQPTSLPAPAYVDELGDAATPFEDVTHYNNYYEFSTAKAAVPHLSKDFQTTPWELSVIGLVGRPMRFSLDELVQKFQPEERIYRLRCVEGWSMVIPWVGFSLAKLLKEVEPLGDAQYVRFGALHDRKRMLRQADPAYPWPYQEGLRLDEALNDLTILASGLYGGELPPQNGGGLRLVVPWKYGFKSIKAVVEIELTAERPETFWNTIAPHEYGFYANVNPNVDHPRWSQSSERRIGEYARRDTLMFNGYAEQVGTMYAGMDLAGLY